MNKSDRIILITDQNTPTNIEGEKGEIRFDNNYLYICVENKVWKKIMLSNL